MCVISVIFVVFLYVLNDLQFIKVKYDSHYDTFFEVGRHFKIQIQYVVENYAAMKNILIPFYENSHDQYMLWSDAVKEEFPQYYDEIRGLSDGSSVEFHKIFLLNLEDEITGLKNSTKTNQRVTSCTDVFYNSQESHIQGHNEDEHDIFKTISLIVEAEIGESNEHFVAFTYPGLIPGNAYGWNSDGLTFTNNALFPERVGKGKTTPNRIFSRYLLSSTDLNDFLYKANNLKYPYSYACTINVGSLKTKTQTSIELSASAIGIKNVQDETFSHVNNFKILGTVPYIHDESSTHRQIRIDEMTEKMKYKYSKDDILEILGDSSDKVYPIYRNCSNGVSKGDISTLSTVFYDLDDRRAFIFTSNPRLSQPVFTFNLTL